MKFADGLQMLECQRCLPYVLGDCTTVADLHITPWLSHALFALGMTDRSDFASSRRAYKNKIVSGKRDSFQEVFKVPR